MSFSVRAQSCICQECEKRFMLKSDFIDTVNLDIQGFERNKFISGELNRVKCPFCNVEFTFEIPMIVFSLSQKYAIYVYPTLSEYSTNIINSPPAIILPKNFSFRLVKYQVEALEKYRILKDGLSDIFVEFLKFENFSDADTMPFDEVNMIYKSKDNDKIYFEKINYNNDFLSEHYINCSNYIFPNELKCITKNEDTEWTIVNRITLKKIYKRRNYVTN